MATKAGSGDDGGKDMMKGWCGAQKENDTHTDTHSKKRLWSVGRRAQRGTAAGMGVGKKSRQSGHDSGVTQGRYDGDCVRERALRSREQTIRSGFDMISDII